MRTHGATRLLALILSLRYVARIQTSLNSCDRSQRQKEDSVAATTIFTCRTRRFVASTCRGDVPQRFVASCVSAFIIPGLAKVSHLFLFLPSSNYARFFTSLWINLGNMLFLGIVVVLCSTSTRNILNAKLWPTIGVTIDRFSTTEGQGWS